MSDTLTLVTEPKGDHLKPDHEFVTLEDCQRYSELVRDIFLSVMLMDEDDDYDMDLRKEAEELRREFFHLCLDFALGQPIVWGVYFDKIESLETYPSPQGKDWIAFLSSDDIPINAMRILMAVQYHSIKHAHFIANRKGRHGKKEK